MENTLSWYLWLEAYRSTPKPAEAIVVMKINDEWIKRQVMRLGHFNSLATPPGKKIGYYEPALRLYKNPGVFLGIEVITGPGQWALIELLDSEINQLERLNEVTITTFDFYKDGVVCCSASTGNSKIQITTDRLDITDIMAQYEMLQNGGFGTSRMF
ncbi:hypothetical protein [Sphingobacterium sp. BIGb0116]|uniref:hypothetical protein n=1 Tax=Sphingobacterium sp. BIGb0116 TaxID=2940619 RepID=UPI002168F7B7|nr:hypothetical protein [Sphingobacterium sp. BIGb0116]MCS4165153.1 hypothetical protein [Sphingobacterium sp. BIGb0116]